MGFVNPTAVTVSHAWTFDFVNPCQFWQILWQDGRNFTESSTRSCFQMNVSVILLKIDKNLLFCRFFIFAKTSCLTQLTNNLKKKQIVNENSESDWNSKFRVVIVPLQGGDQLIANANWDSVRGSEFGSSKLADLDS